MKKLPLTASKENLNGGKKCKEELNVLQKLLTSSLDVICAFDANGKFTYVSPACLRVWGYSPQELLGKAYIDMVLPEDCDKTTQSANNIMLGNEVTSFENRYLRKDGIAVPVLWSATWSKEDETMYCVARDARQLKEAETKSKLQEKRLMSAYKLTEIGWWEYDFALKTYIASDEIFRMYGLPIPENNEITLAEFLSYVHPEERPRLQHDLAVLCQDVYFNYEHRIVKPSGEIIHVVHYSEVIRDAEGNPIALHGTTRDITTKKLQQLKLEASEQELQLKSQKLIEILESIGDGFLTVNKEWTVTYWNKKATELLGKTKEAMVGQNLWHECQDLLPLKFCSEYQRAMEQHISVQFVDYFPALNKWIDAVAYPSSEGLSFYFKDITEKKRQEQALQVANERSELVSKATSDALWDWDVLTNTCYFNEGLTLLFGHENKADFVHKNWMDNIHEADKKDILDSLMTVMNNVAVNQWQGEYRFYRKDKSIAHVLDRSFIIRDATGAAVRLVGSMQDVTRLKQANEELQKFSLVVKETVNGVLITDAEERITWVNKAFTNITDYSFAESIGKKPGELLQGPETSRETKNYLRNRIAQRLPFTSEILNYTKSGRKYWIEIKGRPLFDEKGELKQFFAIQTDITARKEAATALALSEEKYKRLFHYSPEPKLIFDAETFRVVDVNSAACQLYGYSKKEFLCLRIPDLKRPEDEQELIDAVESQKKHPVKIFQQIVPHRKKSGEVFYIEITSCPIELTTGKHFMVTGKDMTEKLQLQQQVIAEKVAAQKKIARAIIHAQEAERSEIGKELHDNVCQLLTTSKLYLENINHFPGQEDEFVNKGIDLLKQSITEIRYLSKQLVSPVFNDVGFEASFNELIHHYRSLNLFKICFNYNNNIEVIDKDLKLSIIRILQEQFNNTVKYANATQVEVSISITDNILMLRYVDNGIGFDPNRSKKGIGLTNIKNRASAFRGKMTLETSQGKGCKIDILFPLTDPVAITSTAFQTAHQQPVNCL